MVDKRPIAKQTNGGAVAEVTADSPLPLRLEALENQVAAALSGEQTAAALGNLLTQLDRAIPIAVEYARLEGEKSLDPLASPDPVQARQQSEDATFRANRMATLRPRLAAAYGKQTERENVAAYLAQYAALVPERDRVEEEFQTEYQDLADKLIALFTRLREFQQRARTALGNPPAGVPTLAPIAGAELADKVTLVALDNGKPLWPPPQQSLGVTMAAGMQFNRDLRYTNEWWRTNAQRVAEAQLESERNAARYKQMEREQTERINREERERFAAAHGLALK